jgi:two-component system, sensor histidine kinase LadS
MPDVLVDYGFRLLDVLVFVILGAAAVVGGYIYLRRRWRSQVDLLAAELAASHERTAQAELDSAAANRRLAEAEARLVEVQGALEEARARNDPAPYRALHDHLQHAIAHEFGKGLNYILSKSEEALDELGPDQVELRDKQARIAAKASELLRHAQNVVGLFGLEGEAPRRDLVNLRGVMEGVLKELFPYAEAQGVTLRPSLASIEPVPANRYLIAQAFANLIHNAIKYSPRGGVVDVSLRLDGDGKRVCAEVRDRGRGIEEKDRDRIFELRVRGDGLIEPGSGLGLHYAREIARLHGGDAVLVASQVNQGSTFRVFLPYE